MNPQKTFSRAIIEAFCDDKGNGSMTRWCTLIVIVTGCAFCFIHPAEWYGGVTIIGTGFLGKVSQKRLSERKSKQE